MSSDQTNTAESVVPSDKKRKRPRAARACEFCRSKKYRCDELYPCTSCKKQKVDCIYEGVEHIRQRVLMSSYYNDPELRQTDHQEAPSAIIPPSRSIHNVAGVDCSATQSSREATWPPPLEGADRQNPGNSTTTIHEQITPRTVESGDVEITGVNPHTQSVEFHGKTSSMAFLAALDAPDKSAAHQRGVSQSKDTTLVSAFHNEAFSPDSLLPQMADRAGLGTERYYFRQSRVFLEGHFQNIHFIHPILDKTAFMSRCEDLWFGHDERQSTSFVALYYSVMSLGALVRTWDEGEKLDGLGRLEWSRKLFGLANTALKGLRLNSDIETVQAQFFMAKVSQNELNPSLAYMCLGLATRTCFSAGYNREPKFKGGIPDSSQTSPTISRTWWGLYSLEIEVSFALGRPDSLGLDEYHNRQLPALDDSEFAMIPAMVQFARIVRNVSTSIYLSEESLDEKVRTALQIERDMDNWMLNLPHLIRPAIHDKQRTSRILKEPLWAKRQKLVLELRYYNVKMVLFRPFLALLAEGNAISSSVLLPVIEKCLEAAKNTILQMHEVYINQAFFRTWWYNTTYILYAVSIVLCCATNDSVPSAGYELSDLSDKAVDILEAMDESVVARNAGKMVKKIILQVRERRSASGANDRPGPRHHPHDMQMNSTVDGDMAATGIDGQSIGDTDFNLDFLDLSFLPNDTLALWSETGGLSGF